MIDNFFIVVPSFSVVDGSPSVLAFPLSDVLSYLFSECPSDYDAFAAALQRANECDNSFDFSAYLREFMVSGYSLLRSFYPRPLPEYFYFSTDFLDWQDSNFDAFYSSPDSLGLLKIFV